MKALYLFTIVVATFYAGLVSAATYNTRDARTHGDWSSLELHLGDEGFFRAINSISYSDAVISLDYSKGRCDSPFMVTRIDMNEIYSMNRTGFRGGLNS